MGDSTCPVRREWTFELACGVGAAGPAAEIRHVLAAYERVSDYDIVHDHTLVGSLYAGRFPHLAAVTTNHGPFLSDLGPLYRAASSQVPVIAISHHQASTAMGSTWRESSITESTWTNSPSQRAAAAMPFSPAECILTKVCTSLPGWPASPGYR
jgi:hypothetical protein